MFCRTFFGRKIGLNFFSCRKEKKEKFFFFFFTKLYTVGWGDRELISISFSSVTRSISSQRDKADALTLELLSRSSLVLLRGKQFRCNIMPTFSLSLRNNSGISRRKKNQGITFLSLSSQKKISCRQIKKKGEYLAVHHVRIRKVSCEFRVALDTSVLDLTGLVVYFFCC